MESKLNQGSAAVAGQAMPEIPLQPAALDIWDRKYRLKRNDGVPVDQTMEETIDRVARSLSDVEPTEKLRAHWYREFLRALRHGALPAGRILSNAGAREYKPATSTINCTVSGTIGDSMDAILRRLHEAGITLKHGAGIGYEFSTLRPKGAWVAGADAHTSGPLSFMDIYDRMCFTISSAGGRRGAQMATFDVGHPDVVDFIRAKREAGRLRQFNLSLLIADEFMQAVKNGAEWRLAFPLTLQEARDAHIDPADSDRVCWRQWPDRERYIVNDRGLVACRIYRTVPARWLWDLIMSSTYDYAEPGFILIDRVNELNNNWFCEDIRATNPCVPADAWIHTAEGPRQVADLIGRPFVARIDGTDHPSAPEGFFRTATREVLRLTAEEGYSLRLTADHPVRKVTVNTRWRTESEWCKAGDLRCGDLVLLGNHGSCTRWPGKYTREQGYLLGLLVGDGTLKPEGAILSAWPSAAAINGPEIGGGIRAMMDEALRAARTLRHRADFAGWYAVPGRNEYRLKSSALRDLAVELDMGAGYKHLTPAIERTSSEFYRGFLRGLFDADGSVQGSQRKGVSIQLAQSCVERLETAQRMLLRLGITSRLYRNRRPAGHGLLPDGRGGRKPYPLRAQHELVLSRENLFRFRDLIGFGDAEKQARLDRLLGSYRRTVNRSQFIAHVQSVVRDGTEDVYDVRIPGINTFDANGFHVHNCGEQPLPPFGACLLGSVNLTRFVAEPFTEHARFDWENFRGVVSVFTRMLDNVVEIHGLPLAEQGGEIERKRRHGMGFLGLGSTLAMLGMRYGGAESVRFTEDVAREMAVTGWRAALDLAREKGPAPIMNEDFTVTADMLRRRPEMAADGIREGGVLKGRVLHARYSRYMQRIATVDPELVQALAEHGARFTHHSSIAPTGTISLSMANNASNGIEPSYAHHYIRNVIREGKKSKEKLDVWSYELLAWRTLVDPEAAPDAETEHCLPDWFVTSADVAPQQHVDIQAAAQKWVDSSISKTVNVPSDFPFDAFKNVYMYAYEQGLKGCTTFRFNPGAFQGVLVRQQDLENTRYRFTLEDGRIVELRGNEEVEYDGETHTAANLYDAITEGYYGKW
jgi:ribonucleoside-diphosphate reductase alpha chain